MRADAGNAIVKLIQIPHTALAEQDARQAPSLNWEVWKGIVQGSAATKRRGLLTVSRSSPKMRLVIRRKLIPSLFACGLAHSCHLRKPCTAVAVRR
jgi:hypothetical protein